MPFNIDDVVRHAGDPANSPEIGRICKTAGPHYYMVRWTSTPQCLMEYENNLVPATGNPPACDHATCT